jgi:hypothetical protein
MTEMMVSWMIELKSPGIREFVTEGIVGFLGSRIPDRLEGGLIE